MIQLRLSQKKSIFMFIQRYMQALLIEVSNWKLPKYTFTGEWIDKYIHIRWDAIHPQEEQTPAKEDNVDESQKHAKWKKK